jgi:hypothetical protein
MQKVALALLAAALTVAPAAAQTQGAPPAAAAASRCGVVPPAPTIPDGATANRAAMNAARTAYNEWGAQAQTVLACRRAEVEELRARTDALVNEYNAANSQARVVSEQMVAEVAEFDAR